MFDNYTDYSGSALLLAAFLFAFQIYGDFSGYSDIAIGTARLFGFKVKRNFAYPYFSRDIAEFWRRWHISLTTWFRDYLYIPLGGSRGGIWMKIRNVFIIFIVSGFWHGANWTFIFWGLFNAIFFIPLLLANNNRKNLNTVAEGRTIPNLREVSAMLLTFSITTLGWVFFRAENLSIAFDIFIKIFSESLFSVPYIFGIGMEKFIITMFFILVLIIIEWFGRKNEYAIISNKTQNKAVQWGICYVIAMIIFLFGENQQTFIYFQF